MCLLHFVKEIFSSFFFGFIGFCEIHGPKTEFCDLGYCRYVKPNHVDVADFLQEVTTEEGTHFLLPEFRHLTSNEFVKAYMDSDMYKDVLRIVNNTQVIFIAHCYRSFAKQIILQFLFMSHPFQVLQLTHPYSLTREPFS